jgi:site-specific recombinase XerD
MMTLMLDAFQAYLEEHYAPHTIRAYLLDLADFSTWFVSSTGDTFNPQAVTPLDIRAYKRHLQNGRARPATINRRLAALSTFFRWARAERLVTGDNPTADVPGVDEVKLAPKWLKRTEQSALLRKVKDRGRNRDIALVTLLLNTGLRLSEVCTLQLEDIIDLSERKGSLRVREGIGEKERTVPLNADARCALRAYLAKRPAADHRYVFVGQRGEPLQQSGVQRLVGEYARKAGLAGCTPHTLRHSFAKNLVDNGVSLDRVAALLGHENLNTTRIYTTPSAQDLAEAVELVGG